MGSIKFFAPSAYGVRIGQAEFRADAADAKLRDAKEDVFDLRAQVDRLQMICEGMWSILKARTGATEDELARLIEEIDLRDEGVGGKARNKPIACAMCGRVVSVRTMVCLYCGAKNQRP